MAYIIPNGEIILLEGVPLKPDYEHSIYWPGMFGKTGNVTTGRQMQTNWFVDSFPHTRFSKQSYTRVSDNKINIRAEYNNVLRFNYLMFQNTAYSTNWFYAFITQVDYVNDNMSTITFFVDAIQTFGFNVALKQCYVEREHSATDYVADNTVPEPLELGDYVYSDVEVKRGTNVSEYTNMPIPFDEWVYVICSTYGFKNKTSGDAIKANPWQINGQVTYNGLYYTVCDNAGDVNEFLTNSVDVEEGDESAGIVGIWMFPKRFINGSKFPTNNPSAVSTVAINVSTDTKWGGILNNAIRNNKLYTYPYTFFQGFAPNGDTEVYRQEWFSHSASRGISSTMTFTSCSSISTSTGCDFMPGYRKGSFVSTDGSTDGFSYQGIAGNFPSRLIIESFPQCAYQTDSYKAWLALNQGQMKIDLSHSKMQNQINASVSLVHAANGVVNGTSFTSAPSTSLVPFSVAGSNPNPQIANFSVNAVSSGLMGALGAARAFENYNYLKRSQKESIRLASNLPPTAHGSNNNAVDINNGIFGFHLYMCRIKDEFAYIADDYFTKYGYNTQKLKVPDLLNYRPNYCYIKTTACSLVGSLPNIYLNEIVSIFDNGITFWKGSSNFSPYNVGNYALDNSVLGSPTYPASLYAVSSNTLSYTRDEILQNFSYSDYETTPYYYLRLTDEPKYYDTGEGSSYTNIGEIGDVGTGFTILTKSGLDILTKSNDEIFTKEETAVSISTDETPVLRISANIVDSLGVNTLSVTYNYLTEDVQ